MKNRIETSCHKSILVFISRCGSVLLLHLLVIDMCLLHKCIRNGIVGPMGPLCTCRLGVRHPRQTGGGDSIVSTRQHLCQSVNALQL